MNIEVVRKAARGILGYRSPVYRVAARVLSALEILKREGWRNMRLLQSVTASRAPEEVLQLRSLRYPICVRPITDDVTTLVNNAIREEYGQFNDDFLPQVIVDAGAYIGDTSAYFLTRFPKSRIIALEPNPLSYGLAMRNLAPYGDNANLLQAALWNEVTMERSLEDRLVQ